MGTTGDPFEGVAGNPFEGIAPHVNADRAAELRQLGDSVATTLAAHGINVLDSWEESTRGGATIEVDTGDDAAGGVYISWDPSPELNSKASEELLSGDSERESIRRAGRICRAMAEAIIAILASADYSVQAADDDMRPFAVEVLAD